MTGLSVLYANQAMKDRGWTDVPDRNKVSRLREGYWLRNVAPLATASSLRMQLYWRPDQGELGRRADLPGDGFAYVATMFPEAGSDGRTISTSNYCPISARSGGTTSSSTASTSSTAVSCEAKGLAYKFARFWALPCTIRLKPDAAQDHL